MVKYVGREAEAHSSSPMNILEPVLERLGEAMSPPSLTAQAGMSRGRFAITQCTTITTLLLILLITIIVGFIQLEELQAALLNFLTKDSPTKNKLPTAD
jgi:hypothetical protein